MDRAILSTHQLQAHYGDCQALFGLDLHVFEGEVVAIIGANGAGKSTLMQSIAGLSENEAGQIRFRGYAGSCQLG